MIRKLLTATAAVAAVLAFAPAANAATPASVYVDGTNGTHPVTFVLKNTVEVTMGDLSLSCSDVGGSGTVDEGPLSSPFYNDVWMRVSSAHFDECDGPGGNLMNIDLNCDMQIKDRSTASVTNAITDLKDISVTIPSGCLHAEDIFGGFLCSLDIVGTVNGTFDETPKLIDDLGDADPTNDIYAQDLTISGTGLVAANVSGCFGQVSNGTPIGFSLTFNVISPDGLINQKP